MGYEDVKDTLEEYRPWLLILDEMEKMDMKAISVLFSVMESGLVTLTRHGDHRSFTVGASVAGACNRSHRLPPMLRSRFGFHLRFQPYTREQFCNVYTRYLSERESVPPQVAPAHRPGGLGEPGPRRLGGPQRGQDAQGAYRGGGGPLGGFSSKVQLQAPKALG